MSKKKIPGILMLAGGLAVMILKCAILLKWGAGKAHIPEPGEA